MRATPAHPRVLVVLGLGPGAHHGGRLQRGAGGPGSPRAFVDGDRSGLAGAGRGRLRQRELRPGHLDLEGRGGALHRHPHRRDPHGQAVHQLRARRPVAAPPLGREFGHLRLGARTGDRRPQAQPAAARRASKCRSSTTGLPRSTRRGREEGRRSSRPTATSSPWEPRR